MTVVNPLDSTKKMVDIGVNIFWLFFLFSNTLALIFLSSGAFQRLGSLWVAFLVLIFGLLKLVSTEIAKATEGRGQFASLAESKLANVTYDEEKGWLNYMSSDGIEFDQRLLTKDEISAFVNDYNDYLQITVLTAEWFIGVIATLQWGYGDLFHDWIHNALL